MTDKLLPLLKNPEKIILSLGQRELLNFIPDELYLKIIYRLVFNKKLRLDNPQTYSEKLQWLKLYDRKDIYTLMVDKFEVKNYVAEKIGDKYIIPTLGVWDNFDDIDFDVLPQQFVLKCTHDSGGLVIVRDKDKFNKPEAKKKIEKCLKHSFYWGKREWPYKNVKPRIIAEQYMMDSKKDELRDYKFFCFDGKVRAMFIASDRDKPCETKFDFFDDSFNHLPFTNGHPNAVLLPEKPERFDEMKQLSEKLSVGIPESRVDFYEVDGNVYFGEITFFHWSGLKKFNPDEWDLKFGNWITLPKKL